nr:indole-3-acetaldehyde oxidase-like [Maniola hyperantus]
MCRCTGYRPILQAFHPFASDAHTPSSLSIEDLKICGSSDGCCSSKKSDGCCSKDKSGGCCSDQKADPSDWCMVSKNEVQDEMLHIRLKDNRDWYRLTKLTDFFDCLNKHGGTESYMCVAGNTVKGAFPMIQYPQLIMDISSIPELKGHYMDQNLYVAAGNTLAQMMDIFNLAMGYDGFSYLKEPIDHMDLVASVAIRNLGTMGGNLMIKKQSPGFQSDIYLFLEAIGAEITILQSDGQKRVLSMQGFLKEDMTGKLLLNVVLPPLGADCKLRTYKIMPRSQSVHALVNAAFYYKMDESNIIQECRIVYGALSTNFNRAYNTERYMTGKNPFTNEVLQGALAILKDEMVITAHLTEPSVEYRRQMALGLFYKGLLSLCPENTVADIYRSGAVKHRETRPTSEGHQVTYTDQAMWPITKSIPKTDGLPSKEERLIILYGTQLEASRKLECYGRD